MASFAVQLGGEAATLAVTDKGVGVGRERFLFDDVYRLRPADGEKVTLELNSGSSATFTSPDAEEIIGCIRARLAAKQQVASVYRKGQLQPREMLRVMTEHQWPLYLGVEYKFRSGDAIPVDDVGKDEDDKALKMDLEENGSGDLVLKGRGAPLSLRAGEMWLLPSLESKTGDCLVLRRKLEVEGEDDAPSTFLVVMTTLTVTRTSVGVVAPGKPFDCHSLLETREYMSGTDCIHSTRRVYTRQTFFGKDDTDRIAGVTDVLSADVIGHMHVYMRQAWTGLLAKGTVAAAAGAAIESAGLSVAAAEVVPHWLIKPGAQRRCTLQKSRQGGAPALVLNVEEQAAEGGDWEVVETVAATYGDVEMWLAGALGTDGGDALVLSRDGWQLQLRPEQGGAAITFVLRVEALRAGEPSEGVPGGEAVTVEWREPVVGVAEETAGAIGTGLVRTASQSKDFSEHLITSKWAEYLERPRMFKSGDEIPDEMASGGDAKTCIMTGLALGMTVPVPGFALIGGLGGAVVATPAVQKAVARYIGDSLAQRIVVCQAEFGDFLLSCEFNHVGESWKQADVYSFKAGEFELMPCADSLNGEQLHVVHRSDYGSSVLVVHDYHSVERLGRGMNVRQEVFDGETMVCSSNRYYEYEEGSVMTREVLQPFVPSEMMVATQLEWVETEVDEWLAAHQDEVLAEAKILAIKAQENPELMGHGEALAEMAETALVNTAAFEEVKRKHESLGANQQINAAEMLALGTRLVSELAVNASAMDDNERNAVLGSATKVVEEVSTLAEQSAGIQRLVEGGGTVIDEYSADGTVVAGVAERAQTDAQIAKLLADGERIAAEIATREITTPEQVLELLNENQAFVDELTDLALKYIEDAVCSVEIPAITGEKDWGTYKIAGLAIKRFAIDPDCVAATVTETVRIDVTGVEIEFDAFDFGLDKTTFPAVQDEGKADATATISACVQFGISTNEAKEIIVSDVEAHVRVDALPVTVITANHKWLFNTLLSWFSGTVKSSVQEEVVTQVEDGVKFLDEQLGATLTRIIDSFSAKGDELLQVAEGAVEVRPPTLHPPSPPPAALAT